MNLPNTHFQDFPIEFKEINPEDFPHFEVENNREKIIIEPNDRGFINESLQDKVFLEDKNTVVVNAAVGQGKSYAIIKTIERFYNDEDNEYLIFVASPFVTLVEQYYNEILEKTDVSEDNIYRYEHIGEDSSINYIGKKVQIITVNTLLGNPGEDAFINSIAKRKYINDLIEHCKQNSIKAVFIYDEIHDAIYNFKEKFIFNLWKWKEVVHKNIVLSATFSEASKIVIEYLAELTDKKIKIIECERKRRVNTQSNLYLHYDHSKGYLNTTGELITIVSTILRDGKDLDILCYSKKLAEDILKDKNEGVGKLLYDKYGDDINKCTSELNDNQRLERGKPKNRFKNDKCNIGTNFKTGVSIEKENHAFVIVMPPKTSKGAFKNYYGIFSDGINTVIQAIARKRKQGDIYILLPKPEKFNFESLVLGSEEQLSGFKYWYKIVEDYRAKEVNKVNYFPLKQQLNLLNTFYTHTLKQNVTESFEYIESIDREGLVRLEFPEQKLFVMEDGEDYLSKVYGFFGKDLSSYITYSAFTNQFVNCNLKGVNEKPAEFFKFEKTQWKLDRFFENYFDEDWFNSLRQNVSDSYIYHELINKIFGNHTIIYKANSNVGWKVIKKNENKVFETQLLSFLQRKLYRNNVDFVGNMEVDRFIKDYCFTRGDYFRSCIAHSIELDSSNQISENNRELASAFLTMNYFRLKLIDSIQSTSISRNEVSFIDNTIGEDFIVEGENERFETMVRILLEKDYFIKNEIFDFKNSFIRNGADLESKKASFYNYLKSDFFNTTDRRINNSSINANVKVINRIESIPERAKVLNLVTPIKVLIPEENYTTLDLNQIQSILDSVQDELGNDLNTLTGGIPEDSIPTFRLVDGKLVI